MKIEISPKEYERELNWYDGMMYCQLLVVDGKNDWRLPTKEELEEIWNGKKDFIFNTDDVYWTSDENGEKLAWGQDMLYNDQYDMYMYKTFNNYVRPVRDL